MRKNGISVEIVDCTFLTLKEAVAHVKRTKPQIIGIQSMYSMRPKALELARTLRNDSELLVAGGPQPTSDPGAFLDDFDVVVIGEGEETIVELVEEYKKGFDLSKVKGIAYREKNGEVKLTAPRESVENLDLIPFPARDLFNNEEYMRYYSGNFGYTTTSVITSRGCPFQCDFCSRPVFGNHLRTRSPFNIVLEMENVKSLGYDRIWFADDCFTVNRKNLLEICGKIVERKLAIGWECLSRVDTVSAEMADKMRRAGCIRMFFGIESGNDSILTVMKKQITTSQAKKAINVAKRAGIQVGAFFIVGYPGESSKTILDTLRFASSLPLDYLSFTLPYPIPGTPLYDRVKGNMTMGEWEEPRNVNLIKHKLMFDSHFSESKLKFAVLKGMMQFYLRKYIGSTGYSFFGKPLELASDVAFEHWP